MAELLDPQKNFMRIFSSEENTMSCWLSSRERFIEAGKPPLRSDYEKRAI
ncbi:hypothetical protein [Paenibacillus elgii]|nr:hypothetical protein [Paenibacillus elgii]NEN84864.1 hypothetical protein [Paenibacillus elgii]